MVEQQDIVFDDAEGETFVAPRTGYDQVIVFDDAEGETFVAPRTGYDQVIGGLLGPVVAGIKGATPTAAASKLYAIAPGKTLSAGVETAIAKVADAYFAKTGKSIFITSGTRDPESQARAMYEKLEVGGSFRKYPNQAAAQEIRKAYDDARVAGKTADATRSAMEAVINQQISQGVYISKHLLAGAADVRITEMSAADKIAFERAVADEGSFRGFEEDDPPHWHLQLK